ACRKAAAASPATGSTCPRRTKRHRNNHEPPFPAARIWDLNRMANPVFYLEASARRTPEAVAIIHQDRRYSYQSLNRMAGQVAAGLAAEGFGPGSKIALCCSNRAGFLVAYFGILKIGATVVNLLWTSKAGDFARLLNDSGAEALFCVDRFGGCEVTAEALAGVRGAPPRRQLRGLP